MEQITRERIYPQSANPILQLRLSPLLPILVIMLVGFAVIMLGVRSMAQYTPSPPNPFPAYADVFPGQPMSAVDTTEFSCWRNDFYDYSSTDAYAPTEESCTFTPSDGIFSNVEVMISEGIIRQITFILHDNTLQVGDLAKLLAMPTVYTLGHTAYFILPKDFVIAKTTGYIEQFSLFLPVWSVSFTKLD